MKLRAHLQQSFINQQARMFWRNELLGWFNSWMSCKLKPVIEWCRFGWIDGLVSLIAVCCLFLIQFKLAVNLIDFGFSLINQNSNRQLRNQPAIKPSQHKYVVIKVRLLHKLKVSIFKINLSPIASKHKDK